MKAGDKVKVHPKAYPRQVYDGEILRKTKHGFSVKVVLNGLGFKEVYSPSELRPA